MDTLLKSFQNTTILVIGDVMIDCYLSGKVTRISPEAPVPIMNVQKRDYRPGGAANVALNLQSLGAHPILCSVIGNDEKGTIFRSLMEKQEFGTEALEVSPNRKTTIKYRIIGNQAQMLRVDDEDDRTIDDDTTDRILSGIQRLIEKRKPDAIIFVDYDKGVLHPDLIRSVIEMARRHRIYTSVDPKKRNFSHYGGVDLFKPNLKEFSEGLRIPQEEMDTDLLKKVMKQFATDQGIGRIMTTLSEKGILFYDHEKNSFYVQPAYKRTISDVSGAGDTVMSIATLCMVQGLPMEMITSLANMGGGLVCEQIGVVPVTAESLRNEYIRRTGKHNIEVL